MGVVVAFDYAQWVARYPEFVSVNQATATEYFNEATIYHRNDGGGPVTTAAIQSTLLNMLTAHVAARYAPTAANGGSPSPLVGRITSASEGSVNVAVEFASTTPLSAAWYLQTKYGADYWAATAVYRTMRYAANPLRLGVAGPFGVR